MTRERFVSGRELARAAGTTHTSVQNWTRDGEIKPRADGKYPLKRSVAAVKRMQALQEERDDARAEVAKVKGELLVARRDRARADARLRVVEADLAEQRYVSAEAVKADAVAFASQIRSGLYALAARTAAAVEGALAALADGPPSTRTARIEAVIDAEVQKILEGLQPSKFAPPIGAAA